MLCWERRRCAPAIPPVVQVGRAGEDAPQGGGVHLAVVRKDLLRIRGAHVVEVVVLQGGPRVASRAAHLRALEEGPAALLSRRGHRALVGVVRARERVKVGQHGVEIVRGERPLRPALGSAATHALLHHHKVAEDQLDLHVLEIAHRVDRPLFMGHGIAIKHAQHVRKRVGYAQACKVARVAQRFLGNRRKVQILNRCVGDLGWLIQIRERIDAIVGNFGDADASFQRTHARGFVHTRKDGEQTCLAYHG